jgi:hypothetical protein
MLTKDEAEELFINEILKVGVSKMLEMDGEGRCRNNTYYQIQLNNSSIRYWTNLTESNVLKIRNSKKESS